jgi:hypothetical protein
VPLKPGEHADNFKGREVRKLSRGILHIPALVDGCAGADTICHLRARTDLEGPLSSERRVGLWQPISRGSSSGSVDFPFIDCDHPPLRWRHPACPRPFPRIAI